MMELEKKLSGALIESLKKVFQEMCACEADVSDKRLTAEIICGVRLGGRLEAMLTFSISQAGACQLVSKILGKKIAAIDAEVTEAYAQFGLKIAEEINILLADQSFGFEVGQPKIIGDKDFDLIKSNYLTAVRNVFTSTPCDLEAFLLYKLPVNSPNQQASGPSVILNELDKEDTTQPSNQDIEPVTEDTPLTEEPIAQEQTEVPQAETPQEAPPREEPLSEQIQSEEEVHEEAESSEAPADDQSQTPSEETPETAQEPQESQEKQEPEPEKNIEEPPLPEESPESDDGWMTEAMKKLENVIKEFKSQ
jgi:CheY-specific phosphatase CheX